jgi:hypothetical protein
MKKTNVTTANGATQQTLRDWNIEIVCITIVFLTIFVLTIGEPDLLSALIAYLLK